MIRLTRITVPLVLLLAGVFSLVYGAVYHSAIVSVQHEIEIDLTPPPPGMDLHGGMGMHPEPGLDPFDFGAPDEGFGDPWVDEPPPWLAPPQELLTMRDTVIVHEQTAEPLLILEITYGGVRLQEGVLWRTYTGEPPSLCPT